MRIRLMRLGCDIKLSFEAVTTLQIEDRRLFARIVRSFLSEQGEYAEEPYLLIDGDEKGTSPKKAAFIINSLPDVPINEKQVIGLLYKKIKEQSELDPLRYERIQELIGSLFKEIENVSEALWGSYSFALGWELEAYLRAFGFSPDSGEEFSVLDNCLRFFELCADVGNKRILIFVNAKSFFSQKELEELFENAVFSKNQVLLIESWVDETKYMYENKIVIDQRFCVL